MVTTSHTQSIKDGRIGTLASSVFAAVAHITVPKHDTQSERKARRLRISEERRWGEGRWSGAGEDTTRADRCVPLAAAAVGWGRTRRSHHTKPALAGRR